MKESRLMLIDSSEISRSMILDKVNEYYDEYSVFPTRIYIPKTIENKWASLGSAEWGKQAGEIVFDGIRSVFGNPPVFLGQLLIFWNATKFALEQREEDVENLRKIGYDVRMHEE